MITDVLQTQHGEWLFESPRIETSSTHGTGCTLASAIAAELGFGRPMHAAVEAARTYLRGAIEHAPGFGVGHGPVNHAWRVERTD